MQIEYNIVKSSIPILFIDTFAMINYAKKSDTRTTKLLDAATEKSKKGALICPIGGQIDEIDNSEYSYVLGNYYKHFNEIPFISRNEIWRRQFINFTHSYKKGQKQIYIPYTEAFYKDPVDELREVHSRSYNVHIIKPFSEKIVGEDKAILKEFNKKFSDWHREVNSVNFMDEIKDYQKGFCSIFLNTIKKSQELYIPIESLDCRYSFFKIVMTDACSEDYLQFIESDWFRYIPYILISAYLNAKFFSKKSTKDMPSGDIMDNFHIMTYMPYCDYMFLDNAKCRFLREMKLDALFKTKIYSTAFYNDLLDELNLL